MSIDTSGRQQAACEDRIFFGRAESARWRNEEKMTCDGKKR
jgi:hypothetical protein